MLQRFLFPMMQMSILWLVVVLFAGHLAAQQSYTDPATASSKTKKAYDKALTLQKTGDREKAIAALVKLQKSDPAFIGAPLKLGEMYYDAGRISEAIIAFESVLALDSFYMPRTLYSLGRIALQAGEFDKAAILLQRYLDTGTPTNAYRSRTEEYLAKALYAKSLVDAPVAFVPEKLPGPVNTEHSESLPAFTVDGQYMLFTRRIRGQEDMYIAYWDSIAQMWVDPEPLKGVNTPGNEGAHAVSSDGSFIAFTACGRTDGAGSCDLYFWERKDGTWLRPVNAGGINSAGWDGHPALTADGRGMYFSSDRPGGHGGRDLWYTERHGDRWTRPVNLGPAINTPGNEQSPFLFFDSRTLYFMSDGHPGLGDFDLFMSTRENDTWQPAKNLGYPINTHHREGAMAIHPDRVYAYYTSDRLDGQNNIYRFRLDPTLLPPPVSFIRGLVRNVQDRKPVIAQILLYDHADSLETYQYTSDSDGRFIATVPHGRTYGVHVTAPGYAFWSGQVLLDTDAPYREVVHHIDLIPLAADALPAYAPVVLNNVQFETGSAELLPSSHQELQRLREMLNAHPDLRIAIHGHTDSVGSDEDNMTLSEARARAVYDRLVAYGISASRLSYRGYGKTRPIASNDTEEGRRLNRRTEFVIR